MITILNTSILTTYGLFEYCPLSLEEAKTFVSTGFQSAIGHQSTAEILTELLGIEIPVNRIEYRQQAGDSAIIFKLNGRPPEGAILSKEDLERIGFEFGLLTKFDD